MVGSDSYTCFDLFAGAGGFSLGAEAAGFIPLGAVELDDVAAKTLSANFPGLALSCLGRDRGDITKLDLDRLRRALDGLGVRDLDLLVACPPCQGFSRIGRGKLNSLADTFSAFASDPRNLLYHHAIEALNHLRPRAFVFENVAGMLHLGRRNVAEAVCEAVVRSGYRARCAILNSAWYGVPQSRERVVVVGFRSDSGIEPCFPARTHEAPTFRGQISLAELDSALWRDPSHFLHARELLTDLAPVPAITVAEAFDDLPPFTGHLEALRRGLRYRSQRACHDPVPYAHRPANPFCDQMRCWGTRFRSTFVSDHFCRWTPRDFETFRLLRHGARYAEAHAIAVERYRKAVRVHGKRGGPRPRRADFIPPYNLQTFEDKWRKLVPDQPSWTITAHLAKDTYSHIHFDPSQARGITPREAARLQSFPDAFVFYGNTGDMFRQIGNAVPPLLARAVCVSVANALRSLDRTGQSAQDRRHRSKGKIQDGSAFVRAGRDRHADSRVA